jgi:hypothetical protein
MESSLENQKWLYVASSIDGNKLAAVVENGAIWTSTDSGKTWEERTSAGIRNWTCITCSDDGTMLWALSLNEECYGDDCEEIGFAVLDGAVPGDNGYEYYQPASTTWVSIDSGETWTIQFKDMWEWVGIASDWQLTTLAVVTWDPWDGIWVSHDSGDTWSVSDIYENYQMDEEQGWKAIASSRNGTKLAAVRSVQQTSFPRLHDGFLHTSTDSGATWRVDEVQELELLGTEPISLLSSTDSPIAGIASSSDGVSRLLIAMANGQVIKRTETGWSHVEDVPILGYDSRLTSIASSGDGEKLVASVYNGAIWTSTNGGETWTNSSSPSPPAATDEALLDIAGLKLTTEQLSATLKFIEAELADVKSHQSDTNYWSAWRVKPVDLS